jgi:hypothetical protein
MSFPEKLPEDKDMRSPVCVAFQFFDPLVDTWELTSPFMAGVDFL